MARRSSTKTEPEAPTTEAPEEASMSTTTPEAPATDNTEAPAPEVAIDLSSFNTAVAAAVAEADESTGTVPEAEVAKVLTEYRNLAGGVKAKNAAKKSLNDSMKEAMNESDIVKARAFLELHESMTSASGGGPKAERQPADPTEAFVQKAATLELAQSLLVPGEGVGQDWRERADKLIADSQAQAEQYLAWVNDDSEDKGDEPEVSSFVKNAVKLSIGKSAKVGGSRAGGSTYTGERRDIGKHILEAFAGQEVGTFLSVAEIRNFKSDEYGDNPPSAGAISARLFPQGDASKCTLIPQGVQPSTNEKGNKGATKTEVAA